MIPTRTRCVRNRIGWSGLSVVVVALCGAAFFYFRWFGSAHGTGVVRFTVHPGESAAEVGHNLQASGLVKKAMAFRWYVGWKGQGQRIQAGVYALTRGDTLSGIVSQLVNGKTVDDTVRVTVPEGYTVHQIALLLQQRHICKATDFLQSVRSPSNGSTGLANQVATRAVKNRWEGYLFPDTYALYQGEPAEDVKMTMLRNFVSHAEPFEKERQRQHMPLATFVTLASMVEREAKVDSERGVIAGIMENRLRIGMPLQIDATVQYALGSSRPLSEHDLAIQDAYNTYRYKGLPPGPIANPGIASMRAVLHPVHTDYLYYVVRNDGSGRDYFARTYAEQRTNMTRSHLNLRRHLAK